jgi:hypothetical protein
VVCLLVACGDDGGNGITGDGGPSGGASWQLLGGAVSENAGYVPAIVHDGANPVVAWSDLHQGLYNAYVKRWNGSTWVQLGGALNTAPSTRIQNISLAVDDNGNLFAAFDYRESTHPRVFVKRWSGSAWVQMGAPLNMDSVVTAWDPSLAMDGAIPVVAWTEVGAGDWNVYVKRWDGSAWQPVGGWVDGDVDNDVSMPSIAIDGDGRPVVAVAEKEGSDAEVFVRRWEAPNWVQLGVGVDPAQAGCSWFPSLEIGGGNMVLLWEKYCITKNNAFVSRWTGTIWEQFGGAVAEATEGAWRPALAVTNAGVPLVAYVGETATKDARVFVKRWTGSKWAKVGGALNNDLTMYVERPSVTLDPSGNPVVVWSERPPAHPDSAKVYVKRRTGS